MFKKIIHILLILFSGFTFIGVASAETINFDINQAGFVAPANGSGSAGRVVVDDQFSSIGVLFRDLDFPTLGVVVGNPTGPSTSPPNVLYSNDGAGSHDYLVRVELKFVDPSNINNSAYVTSISGTFTDAGAGSTLTAYDINDTILGTFTTIAPTNATLSLSGIGQIARVEFIAQDPTGLDNIIFNGLTAFPSASAAPIPTLSEWALILLTFLLLIIAMSYSRKRQGQ